MRSWSHSVFFAVLAFGVLGASCARDPDAASSVRLRHLWTIAEGLRFPESAVYDTSRDVLYVSNVNGYAKNGLGYLSRVALDGNVLDPQWVDGLNGPTGMGIWQDRLYVADIDELLVIDIERARVAQRHAAPDSAPGLNDVTVDARGRVFVSGSAASTIYVLAENGLEAWFADAALRDANGLLAEEAGLLSTGFYFRRIAYRDHVVTAVVDDSLLTDLESVESDGRGNYFVTAIGVRPIWFVSRQGVAKPILERDTYSADIEYIADRGMLVVPSGGDRLFAFAVEFEP